MKRYRTVGQIKNLIHEYGDDINKLCRMIELEEDEKTQKILKQTLIENMEAKKHLEKFLEENPDIFN